MGMGIFLLWDKLAKVELDVSVAYVLMVWIGTTWLSFFSASHSRQ